MITGAHTVIFSEEADGLRAFFRERFDTISAHYETLMTPDGE